LNFELFWSLQVKINEYMVIKHICVIGAGISGLVAAKTFTEAGFEVIVFEKQKGIGGVWEASRRQKHLS
jgi:cation diffusion facilitator CzcD-associated flavoprotein CzcO